MSDSSDESFRTVLVPSKQAISPMISVGSVPEPEAKISVGLDSEPLNGSTQNSQNEPKYDFTSEEFTDIPVINRHVIGF
jgi:hypothetical protein